MTSSSVIAWQAGYDVPELRLIGTILIRRMKKMYVRMHVPWSNVRKKLDGM